jgi:hypoxanthine phosphoribosyltransferase
MNYRLGRTLLSAVDIQARVREMAAAISHDYAGRDLLLICVLKGAAIFWADLCRGLEIPGDRKSARLNSSHLRRHT